MTAKTSKAKRQYNFCLVQACCHLSCIVFGMIMTTLVKFSFDEAARLDGLVKTSTESIVSMCCVTSFPCIIDGHGEEFNWNCVDFLHIK